MIIPKPGDCTPLQYIRLWLFRMSQEELASEIGTSQGTLSKHESAGTMSWDIAHGLRKLRKRKRIKFSDAVLFDGYVAHCRE